MDVLFNYTFPCTLGDKEEFGRLREKLGLVDATPEQVRDYLFEVHNPLAYFKKNFMHMCVPYKIGRGNKSELCLPFFDMPDSFQRETFTDGNIEDARRRGVLGDVSGGDVLVIHSMIIVDRVSGPDLKKYASLYNRP